MKAVVLTVLAIIGCTIADHHLSDCSGNIVDALSKCASAIQGGESLASLQEKCAPDGCNYDCPSVDLINDLQSDLNDANARIDTLQQFGISLAANASQSIVLLTTNQDNIGNIANSNTENINSLQGQVSDSNAKIASLTQQVNNLPTSCQEVKTRWPDSPSGIYMLQLPDGNTTYMHCHLGNLCGSSEGWTRVAYLDMTDLSHECPSVLQTIRQDGIRCCGRKETHASCPSIKFSTKGISYTEICGKVTAYQYASPDDINLNNPNHNHIDGSYVDGVSITIGDPRQHIWTFIASIRELADNCPCANGGATQDFVGDDYFCESGNPNSGWSKTLYTGDRLWDGALCRNNEASCCDTVGSPPWFYKQLADSTTEDIELRVCGDQSIVDEDNPIDSYEIFIK